jgi:hypothetical protein
MADNPHCELSAFLFMDRRTNGKNIFTGDYQLPSRPRNSQYRNPSSVNKYNIPFKSKAPNLIEILNA